MNHGTMTLRLRPASLEDAELLLRWRNEPSTRDASLRTTPIGRDEHIAWLQASLGDPKRRLLVAELRGIPVGTVRADREEAGHVLSWTVSPECRGYGVGKAMVRLLADAITGPIRAEIRRGNMASMRIAEAAGMGLVREDDGILHYSRGATNASIGVES